MEKENSQQQALIDAMRKSQVQAEHSVICVKFVEDLEKLRRELPNHMKFGAQFNLLYKKYFGEDYSNN
jgi:hypothetical protein